MKYFTKILIFFTIQLILVYAVSSQNVYKNIVEKQKQSNQKSIAEVKRQLNLIKKDIIKRNLKFRAEMTEALKYRIQEITGAVVPKNLEKEANVQSSRGFQLFMEFINKLAEAQQKKETKKKKIKKKKLTPEDFMLADPGRKAFSWLAANKLTSVKNQGICGSCWSFTSLAAIESNYKIKTGVEIDLSEQFLIDCAYDRYGRDAGSCNGGWYGKVYDYLMNNKPVLEKLNL